MFWSLWEKMTSWASLSGSGWKLIFQWNTKLLISLKLKWVAEVLIKGGIVCKELSICRQIIRKGHSYKSEIIVVRVWTLEAPLLAASILAHWETCPFKTTHCFLEVRKSATVFKMLPFCLSLCIKHLYHTLSNTSNIILK